MVTTSMITSGTGGDGASEGRQASTETDVEGASCFERATHMQV